MVQMQLEAISAQWDWYVFFTVPNNEKKVYKELVRRNMHVFLPMQNVVRQWSDRKVKMEVPLFPSYIFVQVPAKDLWTILTINGTIRCISFDGSPAVVKESEIETIRRLTAGGDPITTETEFDETEFVRGQKVKVKSGPFSGLEGKVMNLKGKTRLFVELKTISRVLSVEIQQEMLELYEELV